MTTQTIAPHIIDILRTATVEGNAVKLTCGQLTRADYVAVNEVLTRLGGKWNRKQAGHVFPTNPAPLLADVLDDEAMPEKNPHAYFSTPPEVAITLINELAAAHHGPLKFVLEPSAGTGVLVRYLNHYYPSAAVDCCEIDPHRHAALSGHRVVADNFLRYFPGFEYDAVLMNPPFSVEGDSLAYITHITYAWSVLREGGTLISVVPAGVRFRQDKRTAAFRALVEQHGEIVDLPADAFKESGTGVNTCVVVMCKSLATIA